MYRVFEFFINVFQSFVVTHFLIKCLGVKNNHGKPILEYATGVAVTLIYLEILNRITAFESMGVFVYMIISMFFSVFLLTGSVIEKLFYNIIMICGIVFSSLLGAGIVGMFVGKDYFQTIIPDSMSRYIAAVAVQIVLCSIFALIIKLKKYLGLSDSKYIKILCGIPVISVIICCLILYRDEQSYMVQVTYTMLAIVGIFVVNVINLILLVIEHRTYTQRMQERILLNAYEQKEKDVESIKAIKAETDKDRHEIKKILTVATELLDDGKCQEASDFLHRFVERRYADKENSMYTSNDILNYLLNRKIKQCDEHRIDITCFVNGIVDGVEDVDLYILLENLIDNGIEASIQTEKAKMHLGLYADEEYIEIEIGNTVKENVLVTNPRMYTTKKDKKMHGYGLQNVRGVVERYHGEMKYDLKMRNYIICKIRLKKTTIHV